jgi:hypothetical protein
VAPLAEKLSGIETFELTVPKGDAIATAGGVGVGVGVRTGVGVGVGVASRAAKRATKLLLVSFDSKTMLPSSTRKLMFNAPEQSPPPVMEPQSIPPVKRQEDALGTANSTDVDRELLVASFRK